MSEHWRWRRFWSSMWCWSGSPLRITATTTTLCRRWWGNPYPLPPNCLPSESPNDGGPSQPEEDPWVLFWLWGDSLDASVPLLALGRTPDTWISSWLQGVPQTPSYPCPGGPSWHLGPIWRPSQGGHTKIWISLGSCPDTCPLLVVVGTPNTWEFCVLRCHLSSVSESPKREQVWTKPPFFAAPTSSCLGLSGILRLSRRSLTQATCPCVCVQDLHWSTRVPAWPVLGPMARGTAAAESLPSTALYRGSPRWGDTWGVGGGRGTPTAVPPSPRWNVDGHQGEQGNFGVPNHMFPQSKVGWLKNKGSSGRTPSARTPWPTTAANMGLDDL